MSTESRPFDYHKQRNALVSAANPVSAPTITSSTSRRIPTAIAGLAGAEFPSNLRSYRWGRRPKNWLAEGFRVKPEGYQVAPSKIHEFPEEYASCFRR
jgi:hypothetical protein